MSGGTSVRWKPPVLCGHDARGIDAPIVRLFDGVDSEQLENVGRTPRQGARR